MVLERGQTTLVTDDVPASMCENCGEYYLTEGMTEKVMAMAKETVQNKVEVEVLQFAA